MNAVLAALVATLAFTSVVGVSADPCKCATACQVVLGENICYVQGGTKCAYATASIFAPAPAAWIPCPVGDALQELGKGETVVGTATAVGGLLTGNQQLEDGGVALAGTGLWTNAAGKVINSYGRRALQKHGIPDGNKWLNKAGKVIRNLGRAEEAGAVATGAFAAATHNTVLQDEAWDA